MGLTACRRRLWRRLARSHRLVGAQQVVDKVENLVHDKLVGHALRQLDAPPLAERNAQEVVPVADNDELVAAAHVHAQLRG